MEKLMKKSLNLLSLLLIIMFFGILSSNIYAQENIKVNIVLEQFDNNDNLKSYVETVKMGENKEINNISIVSPIKIEFKDIYNDNLFKNLTTQNELKDFISLVKSGDTINLIPTHFEDIKFNKDSFNTVSLSLKPNMSLYDNSKYILKIDSSKLKLSQTNKDIGSIAYTLNINTEKSPNFVKTSDIKIEKKPIDQTISLQFDRNIELVNKDKISLDIGTAITGASVNDKTLIINIGKDLANSFEIKEHSIKIAQNAIKRKGSKDLFVKELNINFSVVADKDKKTEEEKKKDELDNYKNSIADALADEIKSRYKIEYDYDFEDFKDYLRDRYSKDKNYTGNNYIQLYLLDYGYIDDFIKIYGKHSLNIKSDVRDYMNRYAEFRNKRLFFRYHSRDDYSRRGYYDYYDKYYRHRFPEIRVGDDMISQANLEKEQELKQKEKALLMRERGFLIDKNTNFYPTADNSPKIIIDTNSRYFIEFDEYGNSRYVDMGVTPISQNGRTYIAISPLATKLGLWINYNHSTKVSTLSKPKLTVALSPNSSYININGNSENMGIRPILKNGKLMIPVHYLSKAFGIDKNKITYIENTIVIENY